jgi:hypothetical protein
MSEPFNPKNMLRSPREKLGGYVILPRLIDKVRLHAQGTLPEEYHLYLLALNDPLVLNENTLDGRFLLFTGIAPEVLRSVVLSSREDQAAVLWVEQNAKRHTIPEKDQWSSSILQAFPDPTPERIALRTRKYPKLAEFITPKTLGSANPFDLIDYDEGRISREEVIERIQNGRHR